MGVIEWRQKRIDKVLQEKGREWEAYFQQFALDDEGDYIMTDEDKAEARSLFGEMQGLAQEYRAEEKKPSWRRLLGL